jgi:phosphatidylserine decarboxylase
VEHASLTEFFIRRLRADLRPIDADADALVSPVDGRVQSIDVVESGGDVFQAKDQPYRAAELLGPLAPSDLVGWRVWTLYLSPKDYHRIHCPWSGSLDAVAWIDGERFSVAPRVLAQRPRVFVRNARAVLRFECGATQRFAVFVGALNVSRIFVERVPSGTSPRSPLAFARGDELGRFELGSTVILVTPPGTAEPLAGLVPGASVRVGAAIGRA